MKITVKTSTGDDDFINAEEKGDLDKKPRGLHAVVPATENLPEGIIFVLKNNIIRNLSSL